jgi:hypothetical protein
MVWIWPNASSAKSQQRARGADGPDGMTALRMNLPQATPVGELLVVLTEEPGGIAVSVKNEGSTRADRLWLQFRPSAQVLVNPGSVAIGSVDGGATSDRKRIVLNLDPALRKNAPTGVLPVYLLEFEVVCEATKQRMMAALHISFS